MCVGTGVLLADGRCGRAGRTHTHACLSPCCSAPQLFAASPPAVCSSSSQAFAVQHSSSLQSLPAYSQASSSGVCSHRPSCSQLPPSALNHPLRMFAATAPVMCNLHLLWASGKACSRLVLTTTAVRISYNWVPVLCEGLYMHSLV